MFERIAIANRGEIALRIVRTCREMGIRCAVLHSDVDKDSLAVELADDALNLGDVWCYLDGPRIVEAAKNWGADAIHPGYGFLAENAAFARLCREAGIAFIGPDGDVMEHLGQKDRARATAAALGIPCLPGTEGAVADLDEARIAAEAAGWPVLIKAVAGGGGRGMRIARNEDELRQQLPRAMSEAEAAFHSSEVYIEKLLTGARHIEVQVLGDRFGRVVHLGERDCTVQRRHQKLIEESPSPGLSDGVRQAVTNDAVRLLQHIGYVNAGTVEFLVDEDGRHYFLEVNTRLQVEHPVTELLYGVDLVEAQIRIAAGEALPWRQRDLTPRGWAVECRINAEDPAAGFLPRPGLVTSYLPPAGAGVRVDSAAWAGWRIPPFYDSMIAKVITWGPDRDAALRRMRRALHEMDVGGVPTTVPFHLGVLLHEDFIAGRFDTNFVDDRIGPEDFVPPRSRRRVAAAVNGAAPATDGIWGPVETQPPEGAKGAELVPGTETAAGGTATVPGADSAQSVHAARGRDDGAVNRRRIAAVAAAVAAATDRPHRLVAVHPWTEDAQGRCNGWAAAGRQDLIQRRRAMINSRRNRRM